MPIKQNKLKTNRKNKNKIREKNGTKLPIEEFQLAMLCSQKKKKLPLNPQQLPGNGAKIACLLPSAGDRSNIILGVPRSNHKE